MSIRWDAFLARETARELSAALVGARLHALRLDGRTREATLLLEEQTLAWALHPTAGWPRLTGPAAPTESDFKLKGRVVAVVASPDERVVRVKMSPAEGRERELVIELLGNQWNALFVEGADGEGVIRHVLVRREGARPQRVGDPYLPPRPLARAGVTGDVSEADWLAAIAAAPLAERAAALVRAFAWISPLNVAALLGAGEHLDAAEGLAIGYARWRSIAAPTSAAQPVLLHLKSGPQPYPVGLAGTPHEKAESLLSAFEACAASAPPRDTSATPSALDPVLVDRLGAALHHARGRAESLELELARLESPSELRARGDLILARYAEIPKGATRARLLGFDGAPVEVDLDPAAPPHANADAYYQRATKSERAAERLPPMLALARDMSARLDELLARARSGSATEADVLAALPAAPARGVGPRDAAPLLPYRVFRSSGGLEIRVGRGAKHNDDLTFHHSAPDDVWLHARHVGGAHVILRWPGPGNPPSRDLAEAANLAALHSKARTSGSVPVDWTFRKYVRKPRKAPPGRVSVERVETVFVRPDERALRAGLGEPDASGPSPS
jgi:predicted ribosome quality control (RQC) complex YloA/Tae2 family protein